jgi:hypothetical protein
MVIAMEIQISDKTQKYTARRTVLMLLLFSNGSPQSCETCCRIFGQMVRTSTMPSKQFYRATPGGSKSYPTVNSVWF